MPMTTFQGLNLQALSRQLNLILRPVFYGVNPGRWKSRMAHNRLVCILESDGACSFQDDAETIPLTPGQCVFVPAFREILHDQNESMLHFSVHFSLEAYPGVDLFFRQKRCYHEVNFNWIARIREIVELRDPLQYVAALHALIWEALNTLLRESKETTESLLGGYSRYEPLFEFLLDHCTAGIDVAQMARIMHMNKETFSKKFIYDTGLSPKHFFSRLLVKRAERILAGTELSIREVADRLNFCNEFYFSRFFRRHLGCSPREYRKLYRVLAGDPAGAAERRAGEGGKSVLTSPGGTDPAPAASRRTAP